MIVTAVVFGAANGRISEVTAALMSGAEDAVSMTISLAGIMCFWTGIIAGALKPIIKFLFPKLRDREAEDAVVMNITANMLGMSNAATPLGIKAVERLSKLSGGKTATDDMCMFVVINTASVQLIPSTVIAMRQAAGSAAPAEIILPVWICSIAALSVGVLCAKIFAAVRL